MLLGSTFSSLLAEASVSNLEASFPADLSGITIEPIADSTHRAADVLDEVSAPIVPVLHSSCSRDSDVPLALVAKIVDPAVVVGTHGGEGLPLRQMSGGSQKTGSPQFSSYLRRDSSAGDGGAVSSKIKHGK